MIKIGKYILISAIIIIILSACNNKVDDNIPIEQKSDDFLSRVDDIEDTDYKEFLTHNYYYLQSLKNKDKKNILNTIPLNFYLDNNYNIYHDTLNALFGRAFFTRFDTFTFEANLSILNLYFYDSTHYLVELTEFFHPLSDSMIDYEDSTIYDDKILLEYFKTRSDYFSYLIIEEVRKPDEVTRKTPYYDSLYKKYHWLND